MAKKLDVMVKPLAEDLRRLRRNSPAPAVCKHSAARAQDVACQHLRIACESCGAIFSCIVETRA